VTRGGDYRNRNGAREPMTMTRTLSMHLRVPYHLLLWAALLFAMLAHGAVAQTPAQPGPTPLQAAAPAGPTPLTPSGPALVMMQTGAVSTAATAPSAPLGLCQCIADFNSLDFTCPGSVAACQSSCGTSYSYVPDAQCHASGQ
jgi:hypothetical protein